VTSVSSVVNKFFIVVIFLYIVVIEEFMFFDKLLKDIDNPVIRVKIVRE